MSEKLGQEPAFPEVYEYPNASGMSKRFYAACAAMQGLLANSSYAVSSLTTEQLIGVSYECADELLKQESNE